MSKKRLLIVEDDVAVRKALTTWFREEYEVVSYESADLFLKTIESVDFEDGTPTAMLLDFQMPGMNGVELQTAIRQINIEFPILFMSGNAEKKDVIDAFRGGAVDFILKPFSGAQISAVLRQLFDKIESSLSEAQATTTTSALIDLPITPREADVLLLLGRGHRQHEVAEILGIALRTVKMYRGYLKDKLGLDTLVQLTRFCDQNNESIQKLATHHFRKNNSQNCG